LTQFTSAILQTALFEQQGEQKRAVRAGKQQGGAAAEGSLSNHGLPLLSLLHLRRSSAFSCLLMNKELQDGIPTNPSYN